MASNLELVLNGRTFPVSPVKVKRKKIYGWTDLSVTTPDGTECRRAELDGNGQTIVPKGAMKPGLLTSDGMWMERDELVTMDASGKAATLVPSSFDAPITLSQTVGADSLLDCEISTVYQLSGDVVSELSDAVGERIYTFNFNCRAGYSPSSAFLLTTDAGEKTRLLTPPTSGSLRLPISAPSAKMPRRSR